jgi:hypothetical protein
VPGGVGRRGSAYNRAVLSIATSRLRAALRRAGRGAPEGQDTAVELRLRWAALEAEASQAATRAAELKQRADEAQRGAATAWGELDRETANATRLADEALLRLAAAEPRAREVQASGEQSSQAAVEFEAQARRHAGASDAERTRLAHELEQMTAKFAEARAAHSAAREEAAAARAAAAQARVAGEAAVAQARAAIAQARSEVEQIIATKAREERSGQAAHEAAEASAEAARRVHNDAEAEAVERRAQATAALKEAEDLREVATARAAEPEPERRGPGRARFPLVAALTGVGLAICSATDALSRATLAPSTWFLWAGIAVIVAPVIYRLCSADASMGERIAIVCMFGLSLYAVKLMRDPFGYTMPDEFFHAHNAQAIASHHVLFGADSLLPITSKYPGLEGATSALMSMTGLSSFGAGLIVVGAARLVLMLGLFTLFSVISGSPRIAGLGAAMYAGNSNFLFWGTQFSYESLALPLFVVVLAMVAQRSTAPAPERRAWAIPIIAVTAAIVVIHHLTSYLLDVLLIGMASFPWLSRRRIAGLKIWPFALTALALTAGWLVVVASETVGYISPVVTRAFSQTIHTILGEAAPRAPFQASPGTVGTPVTDRIMAFAALVVLLCALPFGLLALWRRHRSNPIAVVLGLAALGFFGVLGLRLAPSAWEIGNRMDEFLFIGLAFVVAYACVDRLFSIRRQWLAPVIAAAGATAVVVGGAITGWPNDAVLAAPIRITAAGHTVESETIALGRWTGVHLAGASFAAPEADARTILLYGNDRVRTGSGVETILATPILDAWEMPFLHSNQLAYAVVDRRQRANDSTRGYGFSVRPPAGPVDQSIPAGVNAKFETLGAPRVFDSGDIAVYDVHGVP